MNELLAVLIHCGYGVLVDALHNERCLNQKGRVNRSAIRRHYPLTDKQIIEGLRRMGQFIRSGDCADLLPFPDSHGR